MSDRSRELSKEPQSLRLPELIDEKQVSKRFGISLNTLRSWRSCGDGPDFYKLGTGRRSPVRYDVAVLAEWLRAHMRVHKARATAEDKHVAL
jgi:transposase